MNDLSPLEMFKRTLQRWWMLVALMVLGGAAGWVFSLLQPPVYESTTVYQVNLDEQQLVDRKLVAAEQLPLEFADQNVYLSPVASMFNDPTVLSDMVTTANSQNIPLEQKDFNADDFSLDRRGAEWFVTVRSTDPARAAHLADLWLGGVDAALQEVRAHSFQVYSLRLQYDSLSKCFAEMDFQQANQCAGTSFADPAALDTWLNGLETQIASEQVAARGIDTAVMFVIISPANLPSHPVLYSVSLLIIAGSLIGLLAGIVLVQGLKPAKLP
jgi:hypothetical protein